MGVKLKKSRLKVAYTNMSIDQTKVIGVISNIIGIPIEKTNRCKIFVIYKKLSRIGNIIAEAIKNLYHNFSFINSFSNLYAPYTEPIVTKVYTNAL
jgi:hypothetical protein